MLLNNQWITEEIKEEIKKYLEINENESMTIQNHDGASPSLAGSSISLGAKVRVEVVLCREWGARHHGSAGKTRGSWCWAGGQGCIPRQF